MCQLTLIDLGNKTYNRIAAVTLMRENSKITNKDGCGVYNPVSGIQKTDSQASSLSLLGHDMKLAKMNDDPLICHVRNATTTLEKKLLSSEHAHPFWSSHFILAHNGSLVFKEKEREAEYKDKELIDSEIFLAELEKNYDPKSVVETLTKTMNLFRGKFAFLIYHKPEKTYYVVRGKTATLYVSEVSMDDGKKGIIVNTELDSLNASIMYITNLLSVLGTDTVFDNPKLLEVESIYKLHEHSLEKIGTLLETTKEVVTVTNFVRGTANTTVDSTAMGVMTETGGSKNAVTKWIAKWLSKNGLSIIELDWMSFELMGKCLLDCSAEDVRVLVTLLVDLEKRNNVKYRKLWESICAYSFPVTLYHRYPDLKFPYFLTEMNVFKNTYNMEREELEIVGIKIAKEW